MSNHEKLFGICENKCLVETIPKENFAVIEGEFELTPLQTKQLPKTFEELGFTENDRLFCVSVMDYTYAHPEAKDDVVFTTKPHVFENDLGGGTVFTDVTPYVEIDYKRKSVRVRVTNQTKSQTQTTKFRALIMKV